MAVRAGFSSSRSCVSLNCESPTIPQIPCCGASLYQDFNLAVDDVQLDVINSSGLNGRVDAFLTDGNCERLFGGSYNGTATSPLCTIYFGPVSTGATSQRKAIRRASSCLRGEGFSRSSAE